MPVFTVPIHESNDCHNPAGPGGGQFCSDSVPVAPGSTPIPPGMVRGYHYTGNLNAVLQSGLSTQHARGSTYGEPNAIWFSTRMPGSFKDYLEVHLRADEVGMAVIDKRSTQADLDRFNQSGHDFVAKLAEIPPSRFVTHHRPWHQKFRYLMQEYPPDDLSTPRWQRKLQSQGYKDVDDIVSEFEKIGGDEYGPAVAAWAARVRRALKKGK